jgi:hypothetical protein
LANADKAEITWTAGVVALAAVVGIGLGVHAGAAAFLHRAEAGAASIGANLIGAADVVAGSAVRLVGLGINA